MANFKPKLKQEGVLRDLFRMDDKRSWLQLHSCCYNQVESPHLLRSRDPDLAKIGKQQANITITPINL